MSNYLAGLAIISLVFSICTEHATARSLNPYSKTTFKPDGAVVLHMFPGWFKPRCDRTEIRGQSRIILRKTRDGRALLNKTVDGRRDKQVLDLAVLSVAEAREVWGKGRSLANIVTFDLVSDEEYPELDVYHLDIQTTNGKVAAYRVRGIGITKPEWQKADK